MTSAVTAASWDQATALHAYRQAAARISAWWSDADAFDKPSLHRPDIVRADAAIQAAFRQRDLVLLRASLLRWEQAITGGHRG